MTKLWWVSRFEEKKLLFTHTLISEFIHIIIALVYSLNTINFFLWIRVYIQILLFLINTHFIFKLDFVPTKKGKIIH